MSPTSPPPRRAPTPPEPIVEIAVEDETETRAIHVPRFHVILFDDDEHTYEYVIEMLMDLFGHSLAKAFGMARRVDANSWVIVATTTKERAELKRDQIHGYGADPRIPRCKGAMSATVESAD